MQVPISQFSVEIPTDHLVKEVALKFEAEFVSFMPTLKAKIEADIDLAMMTQSALVTAKIEIFAERIIKERIEFMVQNIIFNNKRRLSADVKKAIAEASRR